MAFRLL